MANCRERAGFLAILYVMFSSVIVTFQCGVLGQVWYLIVSIPDFCFLLTYIIMSRHPSKIVYFSECHPQSIDIQISIHAISSTTKLVSELTIIRV